MGKKQGDSRVSNYWLDFPDKELEERAIAKARRDWQETSEYQNTYERGSIQSLAYNLEFSKLANLFNCGAHNYG